MEFDDMSEKPLSARQQMDARNLMAEHPEVFDVPEKCADCETLNFLVVDSAKDVVRYGTELAAVAKALCYFVEQCEGAERLADGTWTGCGSHTTPMG